MFSKRTVEPHQMAIILGFAARQTNQSYCGSVEKHKSPSLTPGEVACWLLRPWNHQADWSVVGYRDRLEQVKGGFSSWESTVTLTSMSGGYCIIFIICFQSVHFNVIMFVLSDCHVFKVFKKIIGSDWCLYDVCLFYWIWNGLLSTRMDKVLFSLSFTQTLPRLTLEFSV